jgi:hypothetical protein
MNILRCYTSIADLMYSNKFHGLRLRERFDLSERLRVRFDLSELLRDRFRGVPPVFPNGLFIIPSPST